MKKEILVHLSFLASFLIFVSLLKGWLSFSYWPFWLGAIVGTILPDIDHLLYVFFLRPQELTSQRVSHMVGKRDLLGSMNLLAETRAERTKLVFHTATFQLIFLVLTFFVLTSSGSLLGRGLVLAFSLHLLVDEAVDFTDMGSLSNWFRNFPASLDLGKQRIYWWASVILLLFFAFFL
ncbi:hypothetical protein A3E46_01630 [Candidatus Woesebacteria bacterium RIFCSPHIGHO2_12_FULL_46_16]|uniref:Uncharacterized protein n=1 Tax=Candidatus Woesebacteria bacterium RIFCSPHIGHO2_12_FULL_46_16 TaxID=1802513 RepID=A0A1F8AVV0_9BACT|nr:MAG: hypothetical protein A3E46_01630 [Candidatus Woesebacteria bacterium RIFCSPHIGHO2_12_FULL_46_16]